MEKPDILYEDKQILVAVKEAGMAVQSAAIGQPDMESRIKACLKPSTGERIPYLGVIHRLDQPVEGIVAFARNKKSAAELSRQLAGHQMEKWYLAVVEKECVPGREERLEDYLKKDRQMAQVTKASDPAAKKAVLTLRVLASREGLSLLLIRLQTGRFHQIRCQLAHCGMPIAGDARYGGTKELQKRNIALCAFRLSFKHPETKKEMTFVHCPREGAFMEFKEEIDSLGTAESFAAKSVKGV